MRRASEVEMAEFCLFRHRRNLNNKVLPSVWKLASKFGIQILPRERNSQISTISSLAPCSDRLSALFSLLDEHLQGSNPLYSNPSSVLLQSGFAAFVPTVQSPLIPRWMVTYATSNGVVVTGQFQFPSRSLITLSRFFSHQTII